MNAEEAREILPDFVYEGNTVHSGTHDAGGNDISFVYDEGRVPSIGVQIIRETPRTLFETSSRTVITNMPHSNIRRLNEITLEKDVQSTDHPTCIYVLAHCTGPFIQEL